MKKVFRFYAVRMALVLSYGYAMIGFSHSAKAAVQINAVNRADALPFTGGWTQTSWPASSSFFSLSNGDNKVFARTWDSFNGGCMFRAADDGTNWIQIGSADSSTDILSIVMLDSGILAGTWNGFLHSTDDGTTWNAFAPSGFPADTAVWSIVMIHDTLFAGTTGAIYKSSDRGATWTESDAGIAADARIISIAACGDAMFAGSPNKGVYKSTTGGKSWTAFNTQLADTHISQLVVLDTTVFAVTLTGVFLSGISRTSWAADNSGLKNVNCLAVVQDHLFAGTDDDGVHLSVDGGATWTSFSSGLPANTRIWSLAAGGERIFAGTGSGVWVAASPTNTEVERETPVPLAYTLKQNFPDPFNPSTTIQYALPVRSTVKLVIYNIVGQVVKELVHAEQSAGFHSVVWNATSASGIYFYRVEAVSTVDPHQRFVQVKKMLLLR